MGCGASTANAKPQAVLGAVTSTVQRIDEAPVGLQRGARVKHDGREYIIQCVSSKNVLDLKDVTSGDVVYGVSSDSVSPYLVEAKPAAALQQGASVRHEGRLLTVQYLSSKGLLDLKDAESGDVVYGVPQDEVTPLALTIEVGDEPGAVATGSAPAVAEEPPSDDDDDDDLSLIHI